MCNCIEQANELLKESNAKIAQSIIWDSKENTLRISGARVELEKINTNKRKSLPPLMASFCPFCGQKYEEE